MMSRAGAIASALALPLALLPAVAQASPTSPDHTTPSGVVDGRTRPGHTAPERGPVGHRLPKTATMTGSGGAVASVDPVASQVAIDVLAKGGTAADAAVAATAALNVVEPYATGMGGGGFFVHYDAHTKKVETLDGRETAPRSVTPTTFVEPDGTPMDFDKAVNSGLSVGVPGTPAMWQEILDRWGRRSLSEMLAPAQRIADRGFVVDEAFSTATTENAERFSKFPATAAVFLPGGKPVQPGHVLRQPDLARTFGMLRHDGVDAFYRGPIGKAVVETVRRPATAPGVAVPRGGMTMRDLRTYRVLPKKPVVSSYRGLDVYGMPAPSGGGIAVAEILELVEQSEKRTGVPLSRTDDVQYLHRFAEASAAAFADRNRWVADVVGVPTDELVSEAYAAERACGFDASKAAPRPVAVGQPDGTYAPCGPIAAGRPGTVHDGASTTHLTVADKWGDVVSYTSTIEQFGGSGMVVPGYGFLLNNQLTDFEFVPPTKGVPHPNLPGPGKRPRSSISPTIVLKDGRPVLAVGAAGGATIITTTSQILLGYLDRDLTLVGAVNAPRLSSRNTDAGAEPRLYDSSTGEALRGMGQPMTSVPALGRATAIAMPARGVFVAAAERTRGGGGSAMVVRPRH
ncbi:gamma-glutamyltransferase [Mobilicoccus pelagius]|uniref:Glutathione hydrolase proenzyme n=1 Tax=Mobilicoccus pelagius NBRC 104925 TaxID=1089455 RepID=H5USL9_9MICO|nr:gamma-glutamyltransferase [Mobilicoccus pelagius]GAB48727.1 gamma-glutamyltranspeptidase [Mobilicoccus pelagius NBRC 104925]